jgi:type I restriction enzyme M protein
MAETESPLLNLTDIARLAGVSRTVVSNWRKRHTDFPAPAAEPASGPVFNRDEVAAWLERHRPRAAKTVQPLGFEAKLWQAADALRNSMDPAEYKHVVLGLIFLKYVSDAFDERHQQLAAEKAQGADPEDPDEYRAANVFWVPKEARWKHLQKNAKQPTIGKHLDDAMLAIERDNKSLKGVLPKEYARPALDKQRLGD